MGAKKKDKRLKTVTSDKEQDEVPSGKPPVSKKEAKEHKEQLERLKNTQPEFYEYLKEVDKELLDFDDEGIDDDAESDGDDASIGDDEGIDDDAAFDDEDEEKPARKAKDEEKSSKGAITMDMIDSWCKAIEGNEKIAPVRNLLRAYRTACHCGDDTDDGSSAKLSVMPSDIFNKIMSVTLDNMDDIFRNLMKLPSYGGKKEMMMEVTHTKLWKKYNHLVKSYLGNSLHVLNQMTDAKMISHTLRRIQRSSLFLAAFPSLQRKYVKAALHFWGTGGVVLAAVALFFLRDLCIRLGSDCLDECIKGLYKAYVMNCQYVNATKLKHIHFLRNCAVEFLRVDLPTAYQHAFVFIRQLAMILREALAMKTKEAFRKVYEWKYISCLELWTGAICEYSSDADFSPLAYPLTQIISGVARLVPTARYFPLRLRCARMLNQIAAATNTFIPVSTLLLDMLEMKELHTPPTGGVGKAVDLRTILKVGKPTLKTRSFQEACVYSVIEELAEHLAQWSYSVAFFELSFIPAVRLRSFCKSTKVERFRKETRELVRQIEATSEFTNGKRATISFLPNDPATAAFLEDEKKSGVSPLSKYVTALRQRAQQRNESLTESSVLVGAESSVFKKKLAEIDEEDEAGAAGAEVFSSSWLPGEESRDNRPKEEKKKKKKKSKKLKNQQAEAVDEDIVEDLVLSSDEDEDEDEVEDEDEDEEEEDVSMNDSAAPAEAIKTEKRTPKKRNKHKRAKNASRKNAPKKDKKRKRGQ